MRFFVTILMTLTLIVSTANARETRSVTLQRQQGANLEQKLENSGKNAIEQKMAMEAPATNKMSMVLKNTKKAKPTLDQKIESANAAISLNRNRANIPSRSGDVVFSDGFEDTDENLNFSEGWTILDLSDADSWTAMNWFILYYFMGLNVHSGDYCAANFWTNGAERDNWLFSPEIELTAGTTYTISFWLFLPGYPDYYETDYFEAKIGQETTAAGMTTSLYSNTTDPLFEWTKITYNFTATSTGSYYLGFHSFTPYNEGDIILLDDILVEETLGNDLEIIANAPYTQIPTSQTLNISAKAKNTGTVEQTNITLSAKLNGSSVGTSSPIASLASEATSANLTISAVNIPLGDNTLDYTITSTEGASDNAAFGIKGTADTFAVDEVTSTIYGVGSNDGTLTFGNIFEITAATSMLKAVIGFANDVPLDYSISLYSMTGDLTIAATPLFTQTATRNAIGFADIYVPITLLTPGKYFLCINQLTEDNVSVFYDAISNHTSYLLNGNSLAAVPTSFGAVAIRMVVGTPQGDDAQLLSISPIALGCGLGNTDISVTVRNAGTNTFANFSLSYIVNGGTPVTENVNHTLAVGETYTYNFTQQADLSIAGIYTIDAYVTLTGDQNSTNNNAPQISAKNLEPSMPYTNSFNTTAELEGCGVIDDNNDAKTWTLITNSGVDNSACINYLYSASAAANDWFITKCLSFEAGHVYKLTFAYKVGLAAYPEKLAVYYGTDQTVEDMTTLIGDLGSLTNTTFTTAEYVFAPSTTGTYYIGFKCYSDADMYILYVDDINVSEVSGSDAAITDITAPTSGQNLTSTETVTVTIKNIGSTSITTMQLELTVDGSVIATENYTGNIASGATANYNFIAKANLSAAGNHTIKVRTILTGDINPDNDSKTINVTNTICEIITSYPWTEGFENGISCWTPTAVGWQTLDNFSSNSAIGDNFPAYDGTYMLAAVWNQASNKWIISPGLSMVGGTPYEISFFYNAMGYHLTNQPDNFEVRVGTTATATGMSDGELIFSQNGIYYDFDFIWRNVNKTFTPAANGIYYLGFHDTRANGTGYCIAFDNVVVNGQSVVGMPNINGNTINIFQNNGEINVIVSQNSVVKVLDLYGRTLGNYNVDANFTLTFYQPAGMYLIEVRNNSSISTHKIVVK